LQQVGSYLGVNRKLRCHALFATAQTAFQQRVLLLLKRRFRPKSYSSETAWNFHVLVAEIVGVARFAGQKDRGPAEAAVGIVDAGGTGLPFALRRALDQKIDGAADEAWSVIFWA
jgi:hypothetical protein